MIMVSFLTTPIARVAHAMLIVRKVLRMWRNKRIRKMLNIEYTNTYEIMMFDVNDEDMNRIQTK